MTCAACSIDNLCLLFCLTLLLRSSPTPCVQSGAEERAPPRCAVTFGTNQGGHGQRDRVGGPCTPGSVCTLCTVCLCTQALFTYPCFLFREAAQGDAESIKEGQLSTWLKEIVSRDVLHLILNLWKGQCYKKFFFIICHQLVLHFPILCKKSYLFDNIDVLFDNIDVLFDNIDVLFDIWLKKNQFTQSTVLA